MTEIAGPDAAPEATPAPAPSREGTAKPVDTSKWDRGDSKMDKMLADEGHIGRRRQERAEQPRTISEQRRAELAAQKEADEAKPEEGETKPAPLGDRIRDAQGRFVKADAESSDQNAGGKSEQATANEPPANATPPAAKTEPAAARHKFAGRDFDSPAQAEEYTNNLAYHYERAAQSANEWKAAYDRLKAESANGAKKAPEMAQPASTQPTESDGGVDPKTVAYMWSIAQERAQAGDQEAIGKFHEWHFEEKARALEAKFNARFDEFTRPLQEQKQHEVLRTTIASNWESLGAYARTDGTPLFPEVNDAKASHDIGIYLSQLGFPEDFLATQAGLMAGIGLYRAMMGSTPQAPAAQPTSVAPPPPPSDADGVAAGNPVPIFRPGGPDNLSPEVRRLQSALEFSKGARRLGFSR